MIISSRRDPYRMSARRAPTPGNIQIVPLTRQSLRVPFIDSPLPSPSLPSIFPRRPTKFSRSRALRIWRFAILMVGCCVIVAWLTSPFWHCKRSSDSIPFRSHHTEGYEIVGSSDLPDVPGPVMVTDKKGRARWTISIQPGQNFPLLPSEYARICMEAEAMASHVAQVKNAKPRGSSDLHHGFHFQDRNFMDVAEAQQQGLLPSNGRTNLAIGSVVGWGQDDEHANGHLPACGKSLIFVLQSEDAGFGAALMGLWMSYGLAKEEGRAFFVDDSNWGYGKYTTFFKMPPMPACRPPPASQRIPFPSQAQHLLVSPSTFRWVFDQSFNDRFEDRHRNGVDRQKAIFSLLRTGYEALFRLNNQDHGFLEKRLKQLKDNKKGVQIGIHIRRGDRHPLEPQYESSYIPLDVYAQKAEELARGLAPTSHSSTKAEGTTLVASDDPDVYLASEMKHTRKAQSFISLVSKSTLEATSIGLKQTIDANSGWEGGFFNSLFWSLGSPSSRPVASDSPPPSKYPASAHSPKDKRGHSQLTQIGEPNAPMLDAVQFRFRPPQNALRLREFVARAFLLDIAVLSSSDVVVCGISSVSCRLLGVQLGWEKAIKQKRWKNVDGSLHWQAFIW